MDESAIHWLTFAGGMVGQLAIAAFVYGKLTAQVSTNITGLQDEKRDRKDEISRLDAEQNEQWADINATGRAVEKIKGKLGINGA